MRFSEASPSKLAYGIAEAALATGIGRSRLYEEIRAGTLRTFKVGARTLIATNDLLSWLDSYRQGEHDGR